MIATVVKMTFQQFKMIKYLISKQRTLLVPKLVPSIILMGLIAKPICKFIKVSKFFNLKFKKIILCFKCFLFCGKYILITWGIKY